MAYHWKSTAELGDGRWKITVDVITGWWFWKRTREEAYIGRGGTVWHRMGDGKRPATWIEGWLCDLAWRAQNPVDAINAVGVKYSIHPGNVAPNLEHGTLEVREIDDATVLDGLRRALEADDCGNMVLMPNDRGPDVSIDGTWNGAQLAEAIRTHVLGVLHGSVE